MVPTGFDFEIDKHKRPRDLEMTSWRVIDTTFSNWVCFFSLRCNCRSDRQLAIVITRYTLFGRGLFRLTWCPGYHQRMSTRHRSRCVSARNSLELIQRRLSTLKSAEIRFGADPLATYTCVPGRSGTPSCLHILAASAQMTRVFDQSKDGLYQRH
jgi:hypothetical protein